MNNSELNPIETYTGNVLRSEGTLEGTIGTIVYAHNYNELSNKPSINSVELIGNKTASELGLATPSDINVDSVNGQTGDVNLTGADIDYSLGVSVNAKINDLESQIVGAGVSSVNGLTGDVTLSGDNLNYSAGVTLNDKIDAVESEIPTINYPVTSVNSKTGAVVINGSDIEYSAGININDKIDAVNTNVETVSDDLANLTADVLPLTTGSQTTTAEAIDSKADTSDVYARSVFTVKSVSSQSAISIGANAFDTQRITVSDATLRVISGVAITTNGDACIVQCYFDGANTIQLRVRSVLNSASTYNYSIWYI